MLAVDTNVLVRLLTRDDPAQATRAATLMRTNDVWIAKTVLLETSWVLRSLYDFAEESVLAALRGLAGLPSVHMEEPLAVAKALQWAMAGMDFADALHLASSGQARQFATFDKKRLIAAAKRSAIEVIAI